MFARSSARSAPGPRAAARGSGAPAHRHPRRPSRTPAAPAAFGGRWGGGVSSATCSPTLPKGSKAYSWADRHFRSTGRGVPRPALRPRPLTTSCAPAGGSLRISRPASSLGLLLYPQSHPHFGSFPVLELVPRDPSLLFGGEAGQGAGEGSAEGRPRRQGPRTREPGRREAPGSPAVTSFGPRSRYRRAREAPRDAPTTAPGDGPRTRARARHPGPPGVPTPPRDCPAPLPRPPGHARGAATCRRPAGTRQDSRSGRRPRRSGLRAAGCGLRAAGSRLRPRPAAPELPGRRCGRAALGAALGAPGALPAAGSGAAGTRRRGRRPTCSAGSRPEATPRGACQGRGRARGRGPRGREAGPGRGARSPGQSPV